MRAVLIWVLCSAAAAGADLTVVMDFDDEQSAVSIEEMKRETQSILKDSGLQLDWRLRSDAGNSSFENLVFVRFKGRCRFEPVPYLYDERGPLAFTYSTDGRIQPFAEVSCDNVTAAMRPAMHTDQFAKGNLLMGRALGRVLAHELMHILTRSGKHGNDGDGKAALSGRQLISGSLPLDPDDVRRVARANQ